MTGRRVPRKGGWDTHGLPVEIEVEKQLGFSGKQQIEDYGIEKFNRACLESVSAYERQWRRMTDRVGYWLDMDGAYLTYKNTYIESVWWGAGRTLAQGPALRGPEDPALLRPLRHHPVEPRGGSELPRHGGSVDLGALPAADGADAFHDRR